MAEEGQQEAATSTAERTPTPAEQGTSTPPQAQPPAQGLSKNALKKQLKRQAWEASAPERRAQSRERRKRQKENQRARKAAERESGQVAAEKPKKVKKSVFPADVIVDCAFDEGMTEKEIHSMAQQLSFCYASNKRSTGPFKSLIFTGPCVGSALSNTEASGSKPRECNASAVSEGYVSRLEECAKSGQAIPFTQSRTGKQMDRMGGGGSNNGEEAPASNAATAGQWRRWKNVSITEDGGLDAWLEQNPTRKETTIYLTADTEETISELRPEHTYVIGGLVDRNRYKHVCLDRARALGLKVARLPIDPSNLTKKTAEGKHLASRKVLTVNQVFDILLGWTEQVQGVGGDGDEPSWEVALERGLPGRKFERREGGSVEEGMVQAESGAKRPLEDETVEDLDGQGAHLEKEPRVD